MSFRCESDEIRIGVSCGEVGLLERMIHAKNAGSSSRCRAKLCAQKHGGRERERKRREEDDAGEPLDFHPTVDKAPRQKRESVSTRSM